MSENTIYTETAAETRDRTMTEVMNAVNALDHTRGLLAAFELALNSELESIMYQCDGADAVRSMLTALRESLTAIEKHVHRAHPNWSPEADRVDAEMHERLKAFKEKQHTEWLGMLREVGQERCKAMKVTVTEEPKR